MSKKRPSQVFQIADVYVLGRSPKGALTVAQAHGVQVSKGQLPRLAPAGMASRAINAKQEAARV